MVTKIALEEHFLSPNLVEDWLPTVTEVPAAKAEQLLAQLTDFGEQRLAAMDKAGIARAVLSVSGPGVQAERDTATAVAKAREANDFLAAEIQKRPDRYSGFAHIALQDPQAAADELERCVRDLKFHGAMIDGHSNGLYLDNRAFTPFWDRVEALETLVYLHPADPVVPAPVLDGYRALRRATWEWGFETGSHALRLVFGGLFDRHPKAKLVLGHLGETLPYLLWRFDSRARLYGVDLGKPPSHYIKENLWVTVSGMYSMEPLYCAITALGPERVMFAADYPFESSEEAAHFMDTVRLDEELRGDIAQHNAEKLLGL